ncbi:uncharacterized protein LOC143070729 [Mytilus galloprovincialis]|uniref:uncharacterized protein LOC143070729 n=1 Tax=Mytilus galloprovincialis TaxID=29158 RepID=UPI003F7C53EB
MNVLLTTMEIKGIARKPKKEIIMQTPTVKTTDLFCIPNIKEIMSALPITLEKKNVSLYHTKVREMKRSIEQHKRMYNRLMIQQELSWLVQRDVEKYKLRLDVAICDFYYLFDKLSNCQVQAKEKSIKQLKELFQQKKDIASRLELKYHTLLAEEVMTRTAIKLLERSLWEYLKFHLVDKKARGPSFKQTNVKYWYDKVGLQRCSINVENMKENFSSKYNFTLPLEFLNQKGFDKKLPQLDKSYI